MRNPGSPILCVKGCLLGLSLLGSFWIGGTAGAEVDLPGGTPLVSWESAATGTALERVEYAVEGLEASEPQPTIVYLLGLASPRKGTDTDAAIVADFLAQGYVVISLDYAGHENARMPTLNPDILEMRRQVLFGEYASTYTIDPTSLFIVPAGHRVKRDVYYLSTGRTRAIDIIYPANPGFPSPAIMEFSTDNRDRMGNFALYATRDTLLEGLATEGFAVAMADHPVALGYDGIDPMPDSARKVKAAVRSLRAQSDELGLSGKIGVMGFSRGSGMALMAITTMDTDVFDGYFDNADVDDSVQAGLIMSGRFTYIDLLPTDNNLGKYTQYWGEFESNFEKWKAQGALDYLESDPGFPLFLELNSGEAVDDGEKSDAMHQMEVIQQRLDALGAEYTFVLEEEPAGHKMPIDPVVLAQISAYFEALLVPSAAEVVGSLQLRLEADEPDHPFQLASTGRVPLRPYQLLGSVDLLTWEPVMELLPGEDAILRLDPLEASLQPYKWFRFSANIDPK